MICNIRIVLEEDTAITYETGRRVVESLPFSAIKPFWDYAEEDVIEGTRVYTLEDDSLLILFSIASGQGGIVVCWDTMSRSITHVSKAEYAIAADYYDDMIYTLEFVSNFTTPGYFSLSKIPFGVKDAWSEPESVEGFSLDLADEDDFTGDYGDIDLLVDDEGVTVCVSDKQYDCLHFH